MKVSVLGSGEFSFFSFEVLLILLLFFPFFLGLFLFLGVFGGGGRVEGVGILFYDGCKNSNL